MSTSLNHPDELERIKARFIAARGYWRPWNDALLHGNPAFLTHYASYASYPANTGPLAPRMVELIYVALDASATHLFADGLALHMQAARQAGASDADVFDVLHLVTLQGVSAVLQAADLLHDAAPLASLPASHPLVARIQELWPEQAHSLQRLAAQDAGYVTALLDFLECGAPADGLQPKERLLIQLALHACFTHADMARTRTLLTQGLAQGLTRAALLQTIYLGAHLAVHGAALGAATYAGLGHASGSDHAQTHHHEDHHEDHSSTPVSSITGTCMTLKMSGVKSFLQNS